jgi:hypothetical protein
MTTKKYLFLSAIATLALVGCARGPRGEMPNPSKGTEVTKTDFSTIVEEGTENLFTDIPGFSLSLDIDELSCVDINDGYRSTFEVEGKIDINVGNIQSTNPNDIKASVVIKDFDTEIVSGQQTMIDVEDVDLKAYLIEQKAYVDYSDRGVYDAVNQYYKSINGIEITKEEWDAFPQKVYFNIPQMGDYLSYVHYYLDELQTMVDTYISYIYELKDVNGQLFDDVKYIDYGEDGFAIILYENKDTVASLYINPVKKIIELDVDIEYEMYSEYTNQTQYNTIDATLTLNLSDAKVETPKTLDDYVFVPFNF